MEARPVRFGVRSGILKIVGESRCRSWYCQVVHGLSYVFLLRGLIY